VVASLGRELKPRQQLFQPISQATIQRPSDLDSNSLHQWGSFVDFFAQLKWTLLAGLVKEKEMVQFELEAFLQLCSLELTRTPNTVSLFILQCLSLVFDRGLAKVSEELVPFSFVSLAHCQCRD